MPPTSLGAAASAHVGLMKQRATVYTRNVSTGRYTTILRANLPCRLKIPLIRPSSGDERAELLANRDIWWPADIHLPEQCLFLIDGIYWMPTPGTFAEVGDGATLVANKCQAIRQQTTAVI